MSSDDATRPSLQEMGKRFDLLATESKEYAVFLLDLGGILLCWNAGAERMFGYQSDEIMGNHFSRFFSPEDIVTGQPEHELKMALAVDGLYSERTRPPASTGNRVQPLLRQAGEP
jgi:PAS domain S-box-containing protein